MATIWGAATGSNASRVNVWIEWWEGTIDYAGNRSYVYARFYAQTKADQSSSTYDNNGNAVFYVNGAHVSGITNGTIDFRSPARPQNVLGTWEGWVGRDGAGNANVTFSGSFSISSSWISGGSASGTVALSTLWTSATAPSNPRFDQNPFESSLTFRWNAGAGGVNNAILEYHFYYRRDGGAEVGVNAGNNTSGTLNTSGWARGTLVDFRVAAVTQRGDNPWSGRSGQSRKNRIPNTPTGANVSKTNYVPGETVRVWFTNTGDPDGNLSGVEVATDQSEAIVGTRAVSSAISYVDVGTTGWSPGSQRRFRARGYDALGVRGAWSAYTAAVRLGVPIKIAAVQGAVDKQGAKIMIAPVQGSINKNVTGMKIAPVQGAINKTVF